MVDIIKILQEQARVYGRNKNIKPKSKFELVPYKNQFIAKKEYIALRIGSDIPSPVNFAIGSGSGTVVATRTTF